MTRGKAYLLVGHKQWGKSRTLKALTADSHHARRISIGSHRLFIRRMSNDDEPNGFREQIRKLRPVQHGDVILAFCPVFDQDADAILSDLEKYYDIHSFVLKYSFDGKRYITEKEIASLHEYGPIQIFDRRAESADRAKSLRAFIEHYI